MQIPQFTNHVATNFFLWAMLITAFVMAVYTYAVFHDDHLPHLPSDSKKHFLVANSSEAEWTGKVKLAADNKTLESTVPLYLNTPASNRMAQARGVSNSALNALSSTLEYYASEDLSDNAGVQWRAITAAGAGGQVVTPNSQYVNVLATKSKKDTYAQVRLSGYVKIEVFTAANQGNTATNYALNLTNIPLPSTQVARGSLHLMDCTMDINNLRQGPLVGAEYSCNMVGGTLSFGATYSAPLDQVVTPKVTKDVIWDLTNTSGRGSPYTEVEFFFDITYQSDPDAVAVSTTVY